jgi:hypothetical protein
LSSTTSFGGADRRRWTRGENFSSPTTMNASAIEQQHRGPGLREAFGLGPRPFPEPGKRGLGRIGRAVFEPC